MSLQCTCSRFLTGTRHCYNHETILLYCFKPKYLSLNKKVDDSCKMLIESRINNFTSLWNWIFTFMMVTKTTIKFLKSVELVFTNDYCLESCNELISVVYFVITLLFFYFIYLLIQFLYLGCTSFIKHRPINYNEQVWVYTTSWVYIYYNPSLVYLWIIN